MATEVLMPQMGESIAEGTITRWLAKVGDTVTQDDPLLEISTDKVDSEIPCPANGVLLEIRHQEGETVGVNEIVGVIGEAGEAVGDTSAAAPATAAKAEAGDAGSAPEAPVTATEAAPAGSLDERLRRFSSPVVRSIAKKEGVDITQLQGTGLRGRVTKKDILAHLDERAKAPAAAPAAATAAAAAPAAKPAGGFSVQAYYPGENVTIEPMSRIRSITAAHMVYSKATSAHVSTVFHIDMSRIAALRARIKNRFFQEVGTKLTFMPFIFRAVANGLQKYPQMNAAIDGSNIVYKNDINLGMAVAMDPGLIVPVIKKADELSIIGLTRTANGLAERARSKKLKPEETQGGTFTITNPGAFGSQFGTPIINQPQVAILGIGTIEKRAVVMTDAEGHDHLAIRTMAYFTITFDHRLIDGADGDYFMNVVKATLEEDEWEELKQFAQ